MLELIGIPGVYRHHTTVDVEFSDHRGANEILLECTPLTALPQPQEPDQNVLSWVLVGQERLPAAVGVIVPSNEFNVLRGDLVMYLLDAHLPGTYVPAGQVQVLHPLQSEFTEVSMIDTTGYEGHRNIALDAIDSNPGWNKGENLSNQVNECIGVIVLVLACLPQLIEASATYDERRVYFQAIGSELRVLKVFLEPLYVSLDPHVR